MQDTNKNKKSQSNFPSDILEDLKQSGKERPWRKNKFLTKAVWSIFSQTPGLEKLGERMSSCAKCLEFAGCKDVNHGKKLKRASFCKARMCVMCQWRKSLVARSQLLTAVTGHREKYSTDVPIFLTLTVVNVPISELKETLDQMGVAWRRLMQLDVVKRVVRSSFKSIEVTYNHDREEAHPHIHAVLMVPHHYFYKERGMYIPQQEWVRLWQQSMRDDRITQVDIRKLKPREHGTLESFVAEAAKYATKPMSYISVNAKGEPEAEREVVVALHEALRNRRLVEFGGYFKQVLKEKKLADIEKADLVVVDEEGGGDEGASKENACKICGKALVKEIYAWNEVVRQYVRVQCRGPT